MTLSTRWRHDLAGLLTILLVLIQSALFLGRSAVAFDADLKRGQTLSRSASESPTGNSTGVESSARGVDLRPAFRDLGLTTRSQGSRGTCSVFTVTRAIEFALGSEQRRDTRLSVEFLNWASNRVIRKWRDGGFFSDIWKGFERYGVCNEEEMPYVAKFDASSRPSPAALAQGRQCLDAGLELHWIKRWDPRRGLSNDQFALIKETLRNGWPVCGGFLWPRAPTWDKNVLRMTSRENVRDGHSVLLVGFRDDVSAPGGGVFLIQNTSRGPRDGTLSYEYVRTYMNDAAWIGYDQD